MKKSLQLILLLILVSTIETTAQAPLWVWATSAGGATFDEGRATSTDAEGNVVVTGYFTSPSITFGSTTLTNTGHWDIFVVKYDALGNVVWATSAGGTSTDGGYGISTDAGGNVFVTGYFASSSITFGSYTLTKAGSVDIFVVKYDASGFVVWATSAGGTDFNYGSSISTDAGGNVIVTGGFESPSITFGGDTLTNAGDRDIFVVKYSPSGNVVWAASAGGTGSDDGRGMSTDAGGNVVVTGNFDSPSLTFGSYTLTNAGNWDIFVVKYDASGNVVWATSAGGKDWEYGTSVSTDAGGNVVVTGVFDSPSLTFGGDTLTNAGNGNIFVVKYSPSGNVEWARNAEGTDYDSGFGSGISTDADGNVFVTGDFTGNAITFGSYTLTIAGSQDIFVVKYDVSGNVIWATSAGGTDGEFSNGISTDAGGNVVVTGRMDSPSIPFGSTTLTNAGFADIFTAKLDNITGIEENIKNDEVSISPNPAKYYFKVNLNAEIRNGYVHLFNVFGVNIFQETISNESLKEIQLKNISDGIYFVKVYDGKKEYIQKLIIQQE